MAHQHNYFWKVKDFEIFELYFFCPSITVISVLKMLEMSISLITWGATHLLSGLLFTVTVSVEKTVVWLWKIYLIIAHNYPLPGVTVKAWMKLSPVTGWEIILDRGRDKCLVKFVLRTTQKYKQSGGWRRYSNFNGLISSHSGQLTPCCW